MTARAKPRVLLVDDQQGLQTIDFSAAHRLPFEFLMATRGEEALELIAAEQPDVAVIDRDLPDADGYELAERIRDEHPDTHVILVAPVADDDEHAAARAVGAASVITKPIEFEILRQLVYNLLNVHKRRHVRVPVAIDVDYSVGGDQTFLEKSLNVSLGGMFIRTHEPLPLGHDVQVKFMIPGMNRHIEATGRVAWSQPFDPDGPSEQYPGMGIQFEDLEERDRRILRAFLKERMEDLGLAE